MQAKETSVKKQWAFPVREPVTEPNDPPRNLLAGSPTGSKQVPLLDQRYQNLL